MNHAGSHGWLLGHTRAAMTQTPAGLFPRTRKRLSIYFSEIPWRANRPAMKPLRYRVARSTKERPMKWG